jgi:hypothetical protein
LLDKLRELDSRLHMIPILLNRLLGNLAPAAGVLETLKDCLPRRRRSIARISNLALMQIASVTSSTA